MMTRQRLVQMKIISVRVALNAVQIVDKRAFHADRHTQRINVCAKIQ
ncbi:Uncharacterised protein [Salmonella enterica subsp. enterica serovar Bovismorbificans]|uniref:Uncharacterized protein n=1 Tax=Salmonella enterica subsp. enterica serovar Bovismorbificans TaxID=58097 RepID=A0A655BLF6_SALET|nr:Uncharacterised protein [Salmonella enterica subsp. enterica serovar Bovismorbificans]